MFSYKIAHILGDKLYGHCIYRRLVSHYYKILLYLFFLIFVYLTLLYLSILHSLVNSLRGNIAQIRLAFTYVSVVGHFDY